MELTGNENDYTAKCRLSLENYLELENHFFKFANTIYVWDEWVQKKVLSTLSLANLLTNICIGLEESLKLFLQHPLNNLKEELKKYIKTSSLEIKRKNERLKEIEIEDYREISLKILLDFKGFRTLLNNSSRELIYVRPPMTISFEKLFGEDGSKPTWYNAYEEIKHNIFSTYKKASIDLVFDALGAYYLVSKIIAHEGSAFELAQSKLSYFPWYNGEIKIDNSVKFPTSKNWLSHFKSEHFINISIKRKSQNN